MSLLIKNATVLTVDADRRVIKNGAVYVEEGRIADIGPSSEVEARRAANAKGMIDGHGKVVCPGFVNIHSHAGYIIFRGRSEDAGMNFATTLYFPMSTVMTREDREAMAALNYVELLRSGCTSVVQQEEDVEVVAPFVQTLGVRSAMGEMVGDADPDRMLKGEFVFDPKMRAEQMERAVGFAKRWHGQADGRITAMIAPGSTITSSPEQLDESRAAADKLGLRLTMHLGWSPFEQRTIQKLYGMGTFEFARKHGIVGKDVVTTHCYVIEEPDIEILAKSGTHLAHCPLMNSFRGLIAPVNDMKKRGINVALGVDNMFGDYFDVIRSAVTCARIKTQDSQALLSTDALEMATINGAKAMGLEKEIGSLEVGKRADIIMLDYRALGLVPMLDPVQNLAYHAHARDVEMVMVDGQVLVDGGEMTTVDRMEVIDKATKASDAAWARFEKKYGGPMASLSH